MKGYIKMKIEIKKDDGYWNIKIYDEDDNFIFENICVKTKSETKRISDAFIKGYLCGKCVIKNALPFYKNLSESELKSLSEKVDKALSIYEIDHELNIKKID